MDNLVYINYWLLLALLLIAGIGLERLFLDMVRFVDQRWLRERPIATKPVADATPTIITLDEVRREKSAS